MSAFSKNTSSNFAYIKNLKVADNTRASKTVSTVTKIDFEQTDLTIQDATPVPVTSSTPMRKKEKPAIVQLKLKIMTHQRNFYKYIPGKLRNEKDNASEKIKKLEKKTPFL